MNKNPFRILVLAVFTVVAPFSYAGKLDVQNSILMKKEEVESLKHKLTIVSDMSAKYKKNQVDLEKVNDLQMQVDAQRDMVTAIDVEKEELNRQMEGLREEFNRYKSSYIMHVRDAAIGEEIGELTDLSGNKYSKVVIKKVGDLELVVSHKFGTKTFKYDDLPSKLKKRFHVSDDVAKSLVGKESENKERGEVNELQVKLEDMETKIFQAEEKIEVLYEEIDKDRNSIETLKIKEVAAKEKASNYRGDKSKVKASSNEANAEKLDKLVYACQVKVKKLKIKNDTRKRKIKDIKRDIQDWDRERRRTEYLIRKSKK